MRDHRKNYNKSNKKGNNREKENNRKKGEVPFYVTLPYDFVPFAESKNRCYPYQLEESHNNLPKHNCFQGLSGFIEYEMIPDSDLAIEWRHKWNEKLEKKEDYFISGSVIRGKVRSNLEMLSASYPEFINRTQMLYRDVSNLSYRDRLLSMNVDCTKDKEKSGQTKGIERTIQVGFLTKKGDKFYVTPAQMLGDKYFLSIKEHRLMQMGVQGRKFSTIYHWDENSIKHFNKKQDSIEKITKELKLIREQLKEKLNSIQSKINKVFTGDYSLNKIKWEIKKFGLENTKNKLLLALTNIYPPNITKEETEILHNLYRLYVERWGLKAELNQMYHQARKNHRFFPYQRSVYYQSTDNGGIEKIAMNHSENVSEKGYLFNSTNASSKRNHYFVLGPVDKAVSYEVPDFVINAYNQNLDKLRTTDTKKNNKDIKAFYNIFEGYEELIEAWTKDDSNKENNKEHAKGLIVFFQQESGEKKVSSIGRTPYFKIPHKNQLEDLIEPKNKSKVDYANALFGFIPDIQKKEDTYPIAYKSRLRFSPVDIHGEVRDVNHFVLMAPSATANGMYLNQTIKGKASEKSDKKSNDNFTYEDENIKLNGYKYYHVLPKQIDPLEKKEPDNIKIIKSKKVIAAKGIPCTGKIYFRNLSEEELGLLLLSLDWKEVLASKKYSRFTEAYQDKADKAYELIGGAKPYGFGKVRINMKSIHLENKGNDFESLVLNPTQPSLDRAAYIEKFIDVMDGESYFDNVHFGHYVQSKIEKDLKGGQGEGTEQNPKHINWGNISREIGKEKESGKGGGYPKTWRLKTNQQK